MSRSLFSHVEGIIKQNSANWLQDLELRWSATIRVFKPVNDIYKQVAGRESGSEKSVLAATMEAIVIGDDFCATDSSSAGTFTEGWLYTNSPIIKVGDLIEIERLDCRNRRYKCMSPSSVGTTQVVFTKFRLIAIGD